MTDLLGGDTKQL